MPLEESSVREQIWNLSRFRRWSNKNELVFLPQLMEKDENIMGLTSVLYAERKWLLVVTDRKLVLLYRKIVNGFEQTIPLSDIISVSCKKGFMFAKLTVGTRKGEMIFDSVIKNDALAIKDILSGMILKGGSDS